MLDPRNRRERSEPDPQAKAPDLTRRDRVEAVLRRRAARTQLRPVAEREPKRWS